jgi:glycosyltransferase involved in cell wall biosynthesis
MGNLSLIVKNLASQVAFGVLAFPWFAMTRTPIISVITATYNWSRVLRCAIESALLQTFTDFEMIVVGDGCTDDSGEVVASFGDARLHWVNLPVNSGSQSVPNNQGATLARGEYIAYLGHDDVWYPTHLETVLRVARQSEADVVHSVAVMYGPPGAGVLSTTGIFASGQFGRRDFGVPSAMLIRRALLSRIGPWGDPAALAYPADVEFEQRAFAAGARFAATNELTVFKFNAAWRRDSYRHRMDTEQRRMLERIRSGVDFRQTELVGVIRSYVANKAVTTEIGRPMEPGAYARRNSLYKGTALEDIQPRRLSAAERFTLDGQLQSFELYEPEQDENLGTFRWTGPATDSHIYFPIARSSGLRLRLHICVHLQNDLARDVWLSCDGVRLQSTVEETADRGWLLSAVVPGGDATEPLGSPLARGSRQLDRIRTVQRSGAARSVMAVGATVVLIPETNPGCYPEKY